MYKCLVQVGFELALKQDLGAVAARLQAGFAAVLNIDIFDDPLVNIDCQVIMRLIQNK